MCSTPVPSADDGMPPSTQEIFHQQWQIYRKMVDQNYLFHREALAHLQQILLSEAPPAFRFLDLACGDSKEIAPVLQKTHIGAYHGIDLSRAALDLAEDNLVVLDCPVLLEQRDFVDAVTIDPAAADVVWIGQSLHHLPTSDKLVVMQAVREVVGDHGLFLIYEPTSPNGEDRSDWLRRWDAQQSSWSAYSPEEWETMTAHVHAADLPETADTWRELGMAAGFSSPDEIFVAPSNLFRMFRFA